MLNFHYKLDEYSDETRVMPVKKVHAFGRSRYCQFLIAEAKDIGKFLAIDGRMEFTEHSYADYHNMLLKNVPTNTFADPKKALVLGSGSGITSALLSCYGYEVDAVDVDGVLIKAIQEHLSDWAQEIETPHKITTYIYDVFDFLEYVHDKELKYNYDVVVFDVNEPNVASEDCYSKDLIDKIKSVLNPGGVFAYQNGSIENENSIIDDLVEDEYETCEESVSEIAEWKFSTITFKEK